MSAATPIFGEPDPWWVYPLGLFGVFAAGLFLYAIARMLGRIFQQPSKGVQQINQWSEERMARDMTQPQTRTFNFALSS